MDIAGQKSRLATGLYVHVPYCRRVCPYCDFFVVPRGGAAVGEFVDTLCREIEMAGEERDGGDQIATIHFGGGTPSTLTREELARILGTIRSRFEIGDGAEITLEANPEDVTGDYARALVDVGVNRVTLGIQSLDDAALRLLGRKHRADQALDALDAARAGGVANLGVDLIFGVPGQTLASWCETLGRVLAADPQHISAYELTIEPGTELDRARAAGKLATVDPDFLHDLFLETDRRLVAAGYQHYEVSNYSRGPRFRSRHNLNYWRHGRYLGVGPAAHSFDGGSRWWNHRSLDAWTRDVGAARAPVAEREELSPVELRREEILLGLRCVDGFPLTPPIAAQPLADAVARGYLVLEGDRAKPTLAGMTIADELARRLTP